MEGTERGPRVSGSVTYGPRVPGFVRSLHFAKVCSLSLSRRHQRETRQPPDQWSEAVTQLRASGPAHQPSSSISDVRAPPDNGSQSRSRSTYHPF